MRIAATLSALARVLVYHRLEDRQVPGLLREALDLSVALGERVQTVELLEVVAHFAAGSGDAEVAAELVGAADAERERSMSERVPDQHPYFEATAAAESSQTNSRYSALAPMAAKIAITPPGRRAGPRGRRAAGRSRWRARRVLSRGRTRAGRCRGRSWRSAQRAESPRPYG